jgi:hypothetical protein
VRPARTLKGYLRWSRCKQRRRRESNPCTGLCRPLPKPLGHSAVGASFGAAVMPPCEGRHPTQAAPPSGRRDSNPRPSPWQGDALPAEPRPHADPRYLGPSAGSLRRLRSELYPILAQPPTRNRGCEKKSASGTDRGSSVPAIITRHGRTERRHKPFWMGRGTPGDGRAALTCRGVRRGMREAPGGRGGGVSGRGWLRSRRRRRGLSRGVVLPGPLRGNRTGSLRVTEPCGSGRSARPRRRRSRSRRRPAPSRGCA